MSESNQVYQLKYKKIINITNISLVIHHSSDSSTFHV